MAIFLVLGRNFFTARVFLVEIYFTVRNRRKKYFNNPKVVTRQSVLALSAIRCTYSDAFKGGQASTSHYHEPR